MKKFLSLFIPTIVKNFVPLEKTVLSINITTTQLYVCKLIAKGYSRTVIEKLLLPIDKTDKQEEKKSLTQQLESISRTYKSYDTLVSTFPSSKIIYKEMRLPFLEREKIKAILPFELEGNLPFTLQDSVFDFIITYQNTTEKYSDIIVIASQQKLVVDYLQFFKDAGLSIDFLVPETLALQTLLLHSQQENRTAAYLCQDGTKLHILQFNQGILKNIRTLNYAPEDITSINKIIFTLKNFESQQPFKFLMLYGIHDASFIAILQSNFSCPFKQPQPLTIQNNIVYHNVSLDTPFMYSTAAALTPFKDDAPNLLPFEAQEKTLFRLYSKQIITLACLSIGLITTLGIHAFLNIQRISRISESIRSEIIQDLKKNFKSIKTNNVTTALKTAQKEIASQEELWAPFLNSDYSYLSYLSKLTQTIDKEMLGLQLYKMTLNKKTLSLEGKVQSFPALEMLEKNLKQTDLFVDVPDLQKTDFSIVLHLKSHSEEYA